MKEAYLYKKLENQNVQCQNCAHYCTIKPGARGICGVRQNIGGKLYAINYGKIVSCQIDPVEKKPLFHFLPSSATLSIATSGCNFTCANCQNYSISQEPKKMAQIPGENFMPEQVIAAAQENKTPSISYTYVEPTIFSEYALDVMKLGRRAGLKNIWVSNGFMSLESRQMIFPYLDADNIDIKSFSDEFYKNYCGGHLQAVLDTAIAAKKAGIWLEITTLVIPTLSDDKKMLKEIAEFIAKELGKETPWHISRFFGDISWKLKYLPPTPLATLKTAYNLGKEAGLLYVYAGNVPGTALENTLCPQCGALCIERRGYNIVRYDKQGKCPHCLTGLNIIDK